MSGHIFEFMQHLFMNELNYCLPPYFVHISKIKLTKDRRRVTLFWKITKSTSIEGVVTLSSTSEEVVGFIQILQHQQKFIRSRLVQHLNSKYAIDLEMQHDTQVDDDDDDDDDDDEGVSYDDDEGVIYDRSKGMFPGMNASMTLPEETSCTSEEGVYWTKVHSYAGVSVY